MMDLKASKCNSFIAKARSISHYLSDIQTLLALIIYTDTDTYTENSLFTQE